MSTEDQSTETSQTGDEEKEQPEATNDSGKSEEEEKAKSDNSPKDEINKIVQKLNKGYTNTRQEIAELRSNIEESIAEIKDALNAKSGAESGDDEYVTTAKARQIFEDVLEKREKAQQKSSTEAQQYINNKIEEFQSEGYLGETKKERNDFLNFALEHKIDNLDKAILAYQKELSKKKEEEKTKMQEKKKTQQEEGAKIAGRKSGGGTPAGVAIEDIRGARW